MRPPLATLMVGAILVGLAGGMVAVPPGRAAATPPTDVGPVQAGPTVDPARRDTVLPRGWRTSDDEALLLAGDADGLHVLVATQRSGYTWRTVATLREPVMQTDRWIGNACLTGSGRRAVVVYAPRQFTNRTELSARAGFTAVVDVVTGAVTKLPTTTSLAYFNPGCGAGETAVLTQEGGETFGSTRLLQLDAATARLGPPLTTAGQVTSAIPVGTGIVAARAGGLIRVDSHGRQTALAATDSVPFQLRADAAGGVTYLDHKQAAVRVRRTVGTSTTTVATGTLGHVGLARGEAGTVLLTGTDVQMTTNLPGVVRRVATPATATVSTTGALALTVRPDGTGLRLSGTVLPRHADVPFAVHPGGAAGATAVSGDAVSPALATATFTATATATATANDTTDPDRSCAVPRNDPLTEVYQPTPRQVEWAVDEAVQDALTLTRPADWKHDGLGSYSPQAMFPPITLAGGNNDTPPQIMLGILAQESNLWQASGHAMSGEYGNPLVGNYYGLPLYDGDPSNDWNIDFSNADCGYGVAQITDGMRLAGHERPGETALPADQQRAIALDYTVNIAAGLRLLQQKWNEVYNAGLRINDGNPSAIEDWFYAIWAYNSGFHPDQGDGSPWGVGWSNNPVNPRYPADRAPFLEVSYDDARTPQYWPYEEKVLGWAGHPIDTPDGAGFRAAWWVTVDDRVTVKPPTDLFCDQSDDCYPGQSYPNQYPDEPAGPCARADLTCWYHLSAAWKDCTAGACGTGLIRFDTTYPEQPDGTHYPPNCGLAGLPAGSLIVDDVPDSVPPVPAGCSRSFTNAGTFALSFASDSAGHYPSKVDFHQLAGGFTGHFWFAHTRNWNDTGGALQVTGTWTLNQRLTGWGRVLVHLPDHGALTRQASYTIGLGDTSKARVIQQRVMANEWVSLGVFPFSGTPSVSLSNVTDDGTGAEDVAWDAVAFQPLPGKPRDIVVAMGDSYSSGENASASGGVDYYPETDVDGGLSTEDLCHRSRLAWSRKATLPDSTATLGARADTFSDDTDFHLIACSGATTDNVTGSAEYHEVGQLQSGFVDENTTLVTLSIGGNDARFYQVLMHCNTNVNTDCQNDTLDGDSAPLWQAEPDVINNTVEPAIVSTLQAIHDKAPTARIVLMGYPVIFNPGIACSGTTNLSGSEQSWLNDVTNLMATAEQKAVGTAASGSDPVPVTYADPRQAFDGKGVCGSPEDVTGVTFNKSPGEQQGLLDPSQQSFHPNPGGTDAYASVLTATMMNVGSGPADSYGGTTTGTVNVRGGPGTSYPIVGSLAVGTQVHVYCAAHGTTVNGTDLWDLVDSGSYVSDAYVNTGYSQPIAQPCGASTAGSVTASELSGCGSAGPDTDDNYGAIYSAAADWFVENDPAGCTTSYYYTYGNGPTPSGDFARWGYYPGAYATCTLSVAIPPSNGHSFDTAAHYQIVTGADHATVIADLTKDQAQNAGNSSVYLGTFSADGSGYLGVRLDDTSPGGSTVRVVANAVTFSSCRSLA